MKKSFVSLLFFFAIALSMPVRAAGIQPNESVRFSDRLRSLQSKATQSLKSATAILKQKSRCLIDYDACTARDKVALSTAFGFMMGYGIQYKTLIDKILEAGGVTSDLVPTSTSANVLRNAFISTIAFGMAEEVGLTGPLFMRRAAGLPGMISAKLASTVADDPKKVITDTQALYAGAGNLEKFIFLILIATEAYTILKEAAYAVRYEQKSPFIAIARYLKMNAKCIWNERHCMPQKNAELRRLGLYFWLGYLQGHAAREIKKLFLQSWPLTGPPGWGPGRRLGRR